MSDFTPWPSIEKVWNVQKTARKAGVKERNAQIEKYSRHEDDVEIHVRCEQKVK